MAPTSAEPQLERRLGAPGLEIWSDNPDRKERQDTRRPGELQANYPTSLPRQGNGETDGPPPDMVVGEEGREPSISRRPALGGDARRLTSA